MLFIFPKTVILQPELHLNLVEKLLNGVAKVYNVTEGDKITEKDIVHKMTKCNNVQIGLLHEKHEVCRNKDCLRLQLALLCCITANSLDIGLKVTSYLLKM